MARIPEDELERLKAGVSLVRLIEASGVKLERRGKDHVGRCPFHEDGTPSLSVSAEKNLWRCFGCEAGGDVIAWVMKREGVSFRHAVELLKADYAPDASAPAPAVKSTVAKLPTLATPAEDAALMGEVMGYYHTALKRTPEALAYLERRGLMHPELIEHFQLGFSDRTLGYRLPQANRKAGADVRGRLMALGVLRESGHEHLRGSLVVPLFDAEGRVVNLYGRKIHDNLRKGTPDHLYLPGPHRGMFNRAALAASEEIILCEALIDAMTFWCAGYRHVTSVYGAGGMTEEIDDALEAHGVKRVLIAFDRDAAGEKGAVDVAARLAKRGLGVYRVNFPKGMDANAYALSVKPADRALGALLRNAEWLAGGSRRRPVLDADVLDADGLDGSEEEGAAEEEDVQPGAIMAPDPVPSAPSSSASLPPTGLPPPISASPIPPGPRAETMAETEIGERDVVIRLGDRVWRARGLSRNPGVESLKVNLMVRRPTGDGAEAFHVDGLDLLSAKARGAFATEAALELALPLEVVKRDLGLVLLKLEAVQDERLEAAKAVSKATPAMSAAEESAALAWLKAPGLLQRIAADIAAIGVVGEEANAQAAYLAALSRKLDRPLALLIQSTSAAGKSALMDAVLDLVPEEERVAYSAMTGQSLFYIGEADLKHKALAIAEEEGARHASYALKLLQSQGTLTIASTGKDPATGKLITQEYRVEGPVALMMTTTAIDLDEELKNRCLVLTIDEGRDQTRAIHARQRFEETLGGLAAKEDRSAILALHRNAQRLIKPLKVVNPYAERLTFMDDKTRTRRDHRKYLALIRTIALLHQHQRPIRTLQRPDDRAGAGSADAGPAGTGPVCAEPVCYVEATLDDIAAAGALAHAVLGTTLDELPPQTRRLLRLVHELVAVRTSAEGVKPREVRFTRREVRERVLWGDTQLKVHLKRLEELEYVLARRDGGRSVYELAWAGEGVDGAAFVMGLIDVEALRAEQSAEQRANKESYDDDRAGQSAAPAGASRPLVGPRSGGGRDGEHRETPMPLRALRGEDVSDAENARRGSVEQAASYANGLSYLHGGLQGGLHGGE